MSSKVNLNSIRIPSSRGPAEVLNDISNRMATEDAANKRLEAQLVRQRFLDDRYNAEKAEARQREANSIAGLIAGSAVNFNPEINSKTMVPDKTDTIDTYNQEALAKVGQKYSDGFSNIENPLSEKELSTLNAYDKIYKDPTIENKDLALLKLAKEKYDNSNEEGLFLDIGKKIMRTAKPVGDLLSDGITAITDIGRTENEKIINTEELDARKKETKEAFKSNSPSEMLLRDVASSRKRKIKNDNIRRDNETLHQNQLAAIKKLKETKWSGKEVEVEGPRKRDEYYKDSEALFAKNIANMQKSNKPIAEQAAFIKTLLDKKTKADNRYESRYNSEIEKQNKLEERQLNLIDKQTESGFKEEREKNLADYKFLLKRKEKQELTLTEKVKLKLLEKELKEG